jgi:hypothetical protein
VYGFCSVQSSWWLTAIDAGDKGFTCGGRQKVVSGCGAALYLHLHHKMHQVSIAIEWVNAFVAGLVSCCSAGTRYTSRCG